MGVVILLLAIGMGQSFAGVPMLFAKPNYIGQFADSGGLIAGDKVRIAGMDVGHVQGLEIDGDRILMKFSIGDNTMGTESRLMVRTDTILGRKVLAVEPRGTERLRPGGVLPLGQSTTPYEIYDAIFDVTRATDGWDIDTVKRSLSVLSETIDQTYPHLSAALDGVARFSDTIGKRDDQITHLLAQANKVAGVLGDRSQQVNALLVNAQTLLAAFNDRSRAIDVLLENVGAVSTQVQGFINDNANLNRVLEQLRTISDILVERKLDLADSLGLLAKFNASLGEAVGSGPYFKVMFVNLVPGQILQPFIDAAFKNRGLNPEEFWRNAGLPAFKFPDPNGPRFPNAVPPPAPPVLEGTPEHPGPAVRAGSPCSYTPPADGLPRPGDPLPCAHLGTGPYGDNPYGSNYGAPDVLTSAPNPNGPRAPGVPGSALPGLAPPDMPGTPMPLPPAGPGGRTTPDGTGG